MELFLNLAKTQAMLSRRFDNSLGGLGFNEFIILYHLSQAPDQKLSRITLSEKLGLTASGITRILLPMEKIGLVGKETHIHDARISLVLLAPGGKINLLKHWNAQISLLPMCLGQQRNRKLLY